MALKTIKEINEPKWIIENSSFNYPGITLNECRKLSHESIANGLTKLPIPKTSGYWELVIPKGIPFHLIGRVHTGRDKFMLGKGTYYNEFLKRDFISFTEVWNKNVSHYDGQIFFLYDIRAEDIVHVFPCDSNTYQYAKNVKSLTKLPSMCLSLDELEKISYELETYCQITCRTKRGDEIINPYAIMTFKKPKDGSLEDIITKNFGIGCVIVTPDDNAINFVEDIFLSNYFDIKSEYFKQKWNFDIMSIITSSECYE